MSKIAKQLLFKFLLLMFAAFMNIVFYFVGFGDDWTGAEAIYGETILGGMLLTFALFVAFFGSLWSLIKNV